MDVFYFSYPSEGRYGVYSYLGVAFGLVILTALQHLEEKKPDRLSKVYPPRQRSFCEYNLNASFFLSGEPGIDILCIVFLSLFILHLPTYPSR